jgi:hypothetical protein
MPSPSIGYADCRYLWASYPDSGKYFETFEKYDLERQGLEIRHRFSEALGHSTLAFSSASDYHSLRLEWP